MNKSAQNATIIGIVDDKPFHALLDNTDEIVLGYLSFNNRIPVLLGDKVKIQIDESYSKKGKIFYKFPTPSKSKKMDFRVSKETRLEKIKRWRIPALLNHC